MYSVEVWVRVRGDKYKRKKSIYITATDKYNKAELSARTVRESLVHFVCKGRAIRV